MAEPDDMIMPMLREMRAEIAAGFAENAERFAVVDKRLVKIEGQLESYRHVLAGDSLMSRLLTGDIAVRLEALERQVRELQGSK